METASKPGHIYCKETHWSEEAEKQTSLTT